MKKIKRILIVLGLFFFLGVPQSILAQDSGSFGVRPILPENQASDSSYFDIEIETSQEQLLELELVNDSDEAMKVEVEANPAVTNTNGVMTYDGSIEPISSTHKLEYSSIVEVVDKEVEIPASSTEIIEIKVTAPEESFDGTIIGGIQVSLLPNEDSADEGATFQNLYAYVIGLNISEKGNDTEVEPEIVLHSAQIEEYLTRPALMMNFENLSASHVSGTEFTATIYKASDLDKPVEEYSIGHFSVSPFYQFNVPFVFYEEMLEAGDYVVKVTMENEDHSFEFEEAFTVSEE